MPSEIQSARGGERSAPAAGPRRIFRRLRILRISLVALAVLLAVIAFRGWQMYEFRRTVRAARDAGLVLQVDDPIDAIKKDWKMAYQPKLWRELERQIEITGDAQLAYVLRNDLIARLQPTRLIISKCSSLTHLGLLGRLDSLRGLSINECNELDTLDGLIVSSEFESIGASSCRYLYDVRALKAIRSLKAVSFDCPLIVQRDNDMLTAALPGAAISTVGWQTVKRYLRFKSRIYNDPPNTNLLLLALDPLNYKLENGEFPASRPRSYEAELPEVFTAWDGLQGKGREAGQWGSEQ